MPNPFPGMDPYLEGPLWTTVHAGLITEISRQLNPKIQPRYVALIEERIVIAPPDSSETSQGRIPDVGIHAMNGPARSATAGSTTAPIVTRLAKPEARSFKSIEIRESIGRRLVTIIEVLSPTNKRGPGRREYARKRRRLIQAQVHLVEVDFLRVGRRLPVELELPAWPYFVFVSRANADDRVDVWPVRLQDALPAVDVPLQGGDQDVSLDLNSAMAETYGIYNFDRLIDYSVMPSGPLSDADLAWLDARLREAGRRG